MKSLGFKFWRSRNLRKVKIRMRIKLMVVVPIILFLILLSSIASAGWTITEQWNCNGCCIEGNSFSVTITIKT
ncbi:MAG: hypothetical protein A7316_11255 [Candidatus Altiarchaeales archaeon WOR_SM1_86-2]|nr:MAG: hypothetical protein A7316_11255 [Candidatus Altiarchaeales archaeon WOR_SM1_86-2]